jgi:hypothetical protein
MFTGIVDGFIDAPKLTRAVAAGGLRAAGWRTAGLAFGLSCADERARHFAINLRRHPIDIDTCLREECTGVVDLIDTPLVKLDIYESGGLQLGRVLVVAKGARHTSDPKLHAAADFRRHVSPEDDVRDSEAAIRALR